MNECLTPIEPKLFIENLMNSSRLVSIFQSETYTPGKTLWGHLDLEPSFKPYRQTWFISHRLIQSFPDYYRSRV